MSAADVSGARGARDVLDAGRADGVLSALDRQFARRLASLFGEDGAPDAIRWGLAIACRQEAAGHVCADLRRLAAEGVTVERDGEVRTASVVEPVGGLDAWRAALRASPLVAPAGTREDAASDGRPLVLDDADRLYLARAFRDQRALAARLRERLEAADEPLDAEALTAAIARVDAEGAASGDDAAPARRALAVGLTRPLAIVTGGPGTGKTTMVARLVALLAERALGAGEPMPRVRLLAPTGKAAAAMADAFERGRARLTLSDAVRDALPTSASTLHRALHAQTRLDAFGRPTPVRLAADVVIVDEASMVDLAMMRRLLDACVDVPRIVLLGDPDQLASVAAGAVLSELCDLARAAPESDLADAVATLTHSHRFAAGGGIGRLAAAVRAGDADAALALLDDPEQSDVALVEGAGIDGVVASLAEETRRLHEAIATASAPRDKLDRLAGYRVLCAHRRGPLGVDALSLRLDDVAARVHRTSPRSGWFRGRLLLVNRNAPEQDLWNGDVGLVAETDAGLRALFPDGRGGVRALSPGRVPSHESAIAMSVHKSQGSEFDTVDLVLGDRASPITTRELVYTGVTRARERLRIHASRDALREMIGRRIQRDSGLADRLRGD